jgi:hypothetical protein
MSTSGETRQPGFAKVGKTKKADPAKTNMSVHPHDARAARAQADTKAHNKQIKNLNKKSKA